MLRITPDTNVIVSGLYGSGNARRILELAESGAIQIAVSQSILDEIADVLQREKFGWSAAEVKYALGRIVETAELVEPRQTVNVIKDDPDDNRILECAVAARSDYLVTGDKHLLKLGQFGHTKIMKPADFLNMMR
ncbi:MAG: putative toxin-antitoxin system toxin component, PIN family [Acidobacteriaceae bacterium]|nr:putative toxin-antitoxin system toxin component, PIN family [Acidobacteriaceae bacterium]MBV9679777.1 putative toxin-antitoxin system toxin component, PIN family [Acidobacteriaceae bacterium]